MQSSEPSFFAELTLGVPGEDRRIFTRNRQCPAASFTATLCNRPDDRIALLSYTTFSITACALAGTFLSTFYGRERLRMASYQRCPKCSSLVHVVLIPRTTSATAVAALARGQNRSLVRQHWRSRSCV